MPFVAITNVYSGELSLADKSTEDALQAHRCSLEKDRARVPLALSPALAWKPPAEKDVVTFILELCWIRQTFTDTVPSERGPS